MSLEILKPGMLTTVQDTGRRGFQKDGILVSGAMDTIALRIGNLLAGNPENTAALEITLSGPKIQFTQEHLIAITGADLSATINGEQLKLWRPVLVTKGSILEFGAPRVGCRTYLAVAGGLSVPNVLGSSATYLQAGFGGYKGRALQAGDMVQVNPGNTLLTAYAKTLAAKSIAGAPVHAPWSIAPQLYPGYTNAPVIRTLRGPEYDLFTDESKVYFWENEFLISTQSDRMGYRLQGSSLVLKEPVELLSSAVTSGTVQVPSEGNPIILMADHQTTGGYPRLAQVISADLPILAQLAPGKKLRFTEVSLEQAQRLYIHQEQLIEKIQQTLHLKIS